MEKKEIFCPILFLMGDTEGHDKLCGKLVARRTVQYLCRICDINVDDVDNPLHNEAKFINMRTIQRLCKRNDEATLKESYSMYCIENAFHDLQWCDQERCIHGSTPPETLHVLQQGLNKYFIDCLFAQKKEYAKSKKKNDKKAKSSIVKTSTLKTWISVHLEFLPIQIHCG